MGYVDFWVKLLAKSPEVKEALEPMMKWKNVHKDALPAHGQEVLLAAAGVYYCATYDATRQVFTLRDEPDSFFSLEDGQVYYWVEIESALVVQAQQK